MDIDDRTQKFVCWHLKGYELDFLGGIDIIPNYYSPLAIWTPVIRMVSFPPIQFCIVLGVDTRRLLINMTSGQFVFL